MELHSCLTVVLHGVPEVESELSLFHSSSCCFIFGSSHVSGKIGRHSSYSSANIGIQRRPDLRLNVDISSRYDLEYQKLRHGGSHTCTDYPVKEAVHTQCRG